MLRSLVGSEMCIRDSVNAGHNPPVMVMSDEVIMLDKGCTILGSFTELPSIEVGRLILEKEAIILTYTDGLIDVQNAQKEYFNEDILNEFVLANSRLSAVAFNENLMEAIELFKGEEQYPDDFTLLTCKIFE